MESRVTPALASSALTVSMRYWSWSAAWSNCASSAGSCVTLAFITVASPSKTATLVEVEPGDRVRMR